MNGKWSKKDSTSGSTDQQARFNPRSANPIYIRPRVNPRILPAPYISGLISDGKRWGHRFLSDARSVIACHHTSSSWVLMPLKCLYIIYIIFSQCFKMVRDPINSFFLNWKMAGTGDKFMLRMVGTAWMKAPARHWKMVILNFNSCFSVSEMILNY